MKTKPIAIVLVIICTIFTSLGSVFFKLAAKDFSLSTLLLNYNWFIGIAFYLVATVLLVMAFKKGAFNNIPFHSPWFYLGFLFVFVDFQRKHQFV